MYIMCKLFQLKQFYSRFVSQVALVVGEFESVEARSEEGILVRVFTPIGKKEQVSCFVSSVIQWNSVKQTRL
jgi:hypothetical protein